jgi:hypothetical protein
MTKIQRERGSQCGNDGEGSVRPGPGAPGRQKNGPCSDWVREAARLGMRPCITSVGFLSDRSPDSGDFPALVNESILRLGCRLSRFRTIVDNWKMEEGWEEEDRVADLRAETSG